jgi:hypothetical protein
MPPKGIGVFVSQRCLPLAKMRTTHKVKQWTRQERFHIQPKLSCQDANPIPVSVLSRSARCFGCDQNGRPARRSVGTGAKSPVDAGGNSEKLPTAELMKQAVNSAIRNS